MKIYCSTCGEVRPVIIDDCRDAKTGAPFQDIVCEECHLVIAAGTDIKKPWVGLTQQDIDIAFDDTQEGGGFNEFARAIEAKLKEKNNG